jgi:biotin--protein ligase
MDVLVYSGAQVAPSALDTTLTTLRTLLGSYYAVAPLPAPALTAHPWTSNCALLVLPPARPLPSAARDAIRRYVEGGGRLLALSAGASVGRMAGADALSFPQPSGGFVSLITPDLDADPQEVGVCLANGITVSHLRTHPFAAGALADISALAQSDSLVLAAFVAPNGEPSANDDVAGVIVDAGQGRVAAWALALDRPASDFITVKVTDDAEGRRLAILRGTLTALDLRVPEPEDPEEELPTAAAAPPTRPLPQLLVGAPSQTGIVSRIAAALNVPLTPAADGSVPAHALQDAADTFHFHVASKGDESDILNALNAASAQLPADPDQWTPKHVVLFPDQGQIPHPSATPLFDVRTYFSALADARSAAKSNTEPGEEEWVIGEALLYSPAVTSTQTLFDRYV